MSWTERLGMAALMILALAAGWCVGEGVQMYFHLWGH